MSVYPGEVARVDGSMPQAAKTHESDPQVDEDLATAPAHAEVSCDTLTNDGVELVVEEL